MGDKDQIDTLVFSAHALRQMFARSISAEAVRSVIENGNIVASYPEDNPYPSKLALGYAKGVPLHVVLAYDAEHRIGYVVTAYVPEPSLWSDDFKTRREP